MWLTILVPKTQMNTVNLYLIVIEIFVNYHVIYIFLYYSSHPGILIKGLTIAQFGSGSQNPPKRVI